MQKINPHALQSILTRQQQYHRLIRRVMASLSETQEAVRAALDHGTSNYPVIEDASQQAYNDPPPDAIGLSADDLLWFDNTLRALAWNVESALAVLDGNVPREEPVQTKARRVRQRLGLDD